MEQKIVEMQAHFDGRITATQTAIESRLNSIDAVLPQRLRDIEQRQVGFIETINSLSAALNMKIEQIEQIMLARVVGPQTPPSMAAPHIPQSFEGQVAPPTTQHFHVGSPLSAHPAPPGIQPATPDPWAEFSAGRLPQSVPQPSAATQFPIGAARLTMKYWDVKEWNIGFAKVSKELKPFPRNRLHISNMGRPSERPLQRSQL